MNQRRKGDHATFAVDGNPTIQDDPGVTFASMPVNYGYGSLPSPGTVLQISFSDGTARQAAFVGASVLEDK